MVGELKKKIRDRLNDVLFSPRRISMNYGFVSVRKRLSNMETPLLEAAKTSDTAFQDLRFYMSVSHLDMNKLSTKQLLMLEEVCQRYKENRLENAQKIIQDVRKQRLSKEASRPQSPLNFTSVGLKTGLRVYSGGHLQLVNNALAKL